MRALVACCCPARAALLIRPVDYFVLAWLTLALASTAWVARDQLARNPEPSVMRWGLILVTLYGGPLALLVYVLADKEPSPGTHERFVQPLWRQGIGSTVHCIAGDSTGIIWRSAPGAICERLTVASASPRVISL